MIFKKQITRFFAVLAVTTIFVSCSNNIDDETIATTEKQNIATSKLSNRSPQADEIHGSLTIKNLTNLRFENAQIYAHTPDFGQIGPNTQNGLPTVPNFSNTAHKGIDIVTPYETYVLNNFYSPDEFGFANINGTGKWYFLDQSVSNNEQIESDSFLIDNYLCSYFNSLGILTRYVAWFNLEKMGATGYNPVNNINYTFQNPTKRPILYFRIDYATGEIEVMPPQSYDLANSLNPLNPITKTFKMTPSIDANGNVTIVLTES